MTGHERRRLPVLSSAPDVAAEPAPDGTRIVPPFPLLSVAAALPEAVAAARAQVAAFVRVAAELGVRPTVLCVERGAVGLIEEQAEPGHEFLEAGAAAVARITVEAALAGEAVSRAICGSGLGGAELVVSLGADVLAFAEPAFALLVDEGAPLMGYGPMARSVRRHADATISRSREGWAERLVLAVLSNFGARP